MLLLFQAILINLGCFLICLKQIDAINLMPVEREEALRVHNYLRRSVVPPASDMNELKYSVELENVVSEYLNQCKFEHMYHKNDYGENARLADDHNMTRTIMNWFQERVYYDWNKPAKERCYIRNKKDHYMSKAVCGHYTMLVTSKVTRVGCAYNFCPVATDGKKKIKNVYLTFCFYDRNARDHPYKVGEPCTGCGSYYNRYCRNDMCVEGDRGECRITCKGCTNVPAYIPNYCGCDCGDGHDMDCSNIKSTKCGVCKSKGTPCKYKGEDVSPDASKCVCKCRSGYGGEFCQIKPKKMKDLDNSATVKMTGLPWYFGFNYPVDRIKVLRSWEDFMRGQVVVELNKQLKGNVEFNIKDENVEIPIDYPQQDERGGLTFKLFVKSLDSKHYVDKDILKKVMIKVVKEVLTDVTVQ